MTRNRSTVRLFIERRPLVVAAACYLSGGAMALSMGIDPYVPLALSIVALIVCALRRRAVFFFAAIIFLGAMITGFAAKVPGGEDRRGVSIFGYVAEPPVLREDYMYLVLDRVVLDGNPYPYKIRAYAHGILDIGLGDSIACVGSVYPPARQRNPGGMDFALKLWRDGIGLCASINGDQVTIERGSDRSLPLTLARIRETIGKKIDGLFVQQPELVRALVIGDREKLPEELQADFRTSGIAHLLSVSGLHIGCFAFAVDWLLRRLNAPYKITYGAVLIFLLFYAALVGFTASVVRAAMMYALARGARLTGRAADGLTGLCAALLAQLVVKPLVLIDYGFILSFSAVAGLMLFMPVFERVISWKNKPDETRKTGRAKQLARRLLEYLSMSLLTSIAAQCSTLPAIATLYGTISAWSVVGNLFAVPIVLVSLPLCLMSIVVGFVYMPLGQWIAAVPDGLLSMLVQGGVWFAKLPFSELRLPAWPAWLSALYAMVCVLCSEYVYIKPMVRRWLLLALPMLLGASLGLNALSLPGGFTIVFLDAGHADAAVIHAQGQIYLIDTGNAGSPADDYFRHYGVGRIEGIFLSHPHNDHVAGLREVLDQVFVETIYLSSRWDDAAQDEGIQESLALAESRGTGIVYLEAGDAVELAPQIVAEVLQPDAQMASNDANELSMVLHVTYEQGSALFLGDLPNKAEKLMPDADVVKVAHHGSKNATSELLLRTATPSVAVIPCGRNAYGHPAEVLLERIRREGAAIYRADQCGAVTANIHADGMVEIKTFLIAED